MRDREREYRFRIKYRNNIEFDIDREEVLDKFILRESLLEIIGLYFLEIVKFKEKEVEELF